MTPAERAAHEIVEYRDGEFVRIVGLVPIRMAPHEAFRLREKVAEIVEDACAAAVVAATPVRSDPEDFP